MPGSVSSPAEQFLSGLRQRLDAREDRILAPYACKSREAIRRRTEDRIGHRQCFALDADRILHSRAYTRYIDKTQVFYMVENDHITHRVLHVQLVSKIARTMGRFLGLNEDLIEAIALGHDIGHPPFGHDGERFLSGLCEQAGLAPFLHNVQSVFFLEDIERGGRGWNLALQTLDGILCHDGEVHNRLLTPHREKDFSFFDREILAKQQNPKADLLPMTMEGCLVRFADTIAYIGRDIEDAIELDLVGRGEIPASVQETLGNTNGTIVYNLVADLIRNSVEQEYIAFSAEIADRLLELKKFNYERIYLNPAIKKDAALLGRCYEALFSAFYQAFAKDGAGSPAAGAFLVGMSERYRQENGPAAMSRDFIAGMTDDYFIAQARILGCEVPEKS